MSIGRRAWGEEIGPVREGAAGRLLHVTAGVAQSWK